MNRTPIVNVAIAEMESPRLRVCITPSHSGSVSRQLKFKVDNNKFKVNIGVPI